MTLWQRFLAWAGNPLDQSNADKCFFAALVLLPNMIFGQYIWTRELLMSEAIGTELIEYAELVAQVLLAVTVAWIALAVLALVLRRYRPESTFFAHATCNLYAITMAVLCYGWGPTTTYFLGFAMVGGGIGGMLLFGARPTLIASFVCAVILFSAETAVQLGRIPYAPFYRALVEGAQHLAAPGVGWLVRTWASIFVAFALSFGAFDFVFRRWRRRELELEEAQLQLSHAMDVIRRYVPSQLADRIVAGTFSETERYVRRTLTIFFSDIKGFTETADELESEKLSELLNEYLTEMSGIAERFGGTIDKFVGDAVMIFFGAPDPMEEKEQALRAVRMALAMQGRMRVLSKKWYDGGIPTPFEIRVGVNTGAASVGNFGSEGRMDYTAIGTQVNLAARLESHCTPGKILISHATWGLIHEEIPCTPRGEIHVKGIHYPVKVYEIEEGMFTSTVPVV